MSAQYPTAAPTSPPSAPPPLNAEVEVLDLIARQVRKVPWPVGLSALFVLAMTWQHIPHWALLS